MFCELSEGKVPQRDLVMEKSKQKLFSTLQTFLLCDPGWYVHKPGAQNKWDDNKHFIQAFASVVLQYHTRVLYSF